MQVTMSSKGQIVIPAEIRKQFGFKAGDKLELMEFAGRLYLFRLPDDPIAAACGAFAGRGMTMNDFEDLRREDLELEEAKWKRYEEWTGRG
ncbi:MAG: AbrB/MazE/SpoVT family DNA-binding domain-containing protein [Coriobacteriia bacterium]